MLYFDSHDILLALVALNKKIYVCFSCIGIIGWRIKITIKSFTLNSKLQFERNI